MFDTNIVISGLIAPASIPAYLLRSIRKSCTLLCSEATSQELFEVLERPRFDRYVPLPLRQQFCSLLRAEMQLVDVRSRLSICRDPRDDKFLELAVDGHADCIVTGDADLLALHPFRGIEIVSPSDFLARFPS